MQTFQAIKKAAVAVVLSAALVACGDEPAEEQTSSNGRLTLVGAGATFPEPLYDKWIEVYTEAHPEVAIHYDGVGSGEGIRKFVAREVDFGASDAAMDDASIAKVEDGVKLIPATAGLIVLAYNVPGLTGELRLPRDVYVDIFLGKIYRWDDERIVAANPGVDLPPRLIQTVVRRDSSGTTFAFTNHLSAISEAWRNEGPGTGKQVDWPGGAMTGAGNDGVAQKVVISVGSIGYMEYGYASRLGLPMAILENRDGNFVKPGAKSGRAALANAAEQLPDDLRLFVPDPVGAESYPIVSLSWLLLYADYPDDKATALKNAVAWGLSEGQSIAEGIGYIPLPEEITSRANEALASIQ